VKCEFFFSPELQGRAVSRIGSKRDLNKEYGANRRRALKVV
jgi:hypothetical protein